MASKAILVWVLLMLCAACVKTAGAQKPDYLSDDEEDKVREAQEPSDRIELYLTLAQTRLDRITEFRSKPMDPQYDNGAYLDKLLDQYISITDDLKNWVQEQYDRRGDMRRGLRKVLETGPKQLDDLRRIQETPDAYAADYAGSLRDAKDDLTDALDGATKALGNQVKMLGELKPDAPEPEKVKIKEEKKRNKEEEKLQKKQRKQTPPADSDDD